MSRVEPVEVLLDRLSVEVEGRPLLRDVSLAIPAGKITVIVGGSGAGKSVLLRILAGLAPADSGPIRWSGDVVIAAPPGAEVAVANTFQPRVGVVFQSFALLDQWSPLGNVRLAIDHRADPALPPEQTGEQWLQELRVPRQTPVAVLSGGQKQRLAIARTLAAAPAVVLYDEPTSGLDAASGRQVAELIQRTQRVHRRTSVVVTHDYHTLLGIADEVLLLDAAAKTLVRVPRPQWEMIAERMQPVPSPEPLATSEPLPAAGQAATGTWAAVGRAALTSGLRHGWQRGLHLLEATGAAARGLGRSEGPRHGTFRWRWLGRFLLHYLRLTGGVSAMVYLAVAGVIVGFTTTYFTFKFMPYRLYTQPLLLEDLLASIGFALYRILVPVLATILVAARCGAAVAADVGVKRYGSQIDALWSLGISPRLYLQLPILVAFLIATPLLTALAFQVARGLSLLCFTSMHAELGPYFWHQHFHRQLIDASGSLGGSWFSSGWDRSSWRWVLFKTLACGVGVGWISYHQGNRPKGSASDVSEAITATVLWATLYVLVVHFVVALYEF